MLFICYKTQYDTMIRYCIMLHCKITVLWYDILGYNRIYYHLIQYVIRGYVVLHYATLDCRIQNDTIYNYMECYEVLYYFVSLKYDSLQFYDAYPLCTSHH